jgi:hypothetical protein
MLWDFFFNFNQNYAMFTNTIMMKNKIVAFFMPE